ncbi:MAG: hypothetical protein EPO28_12690 [Saprospiraceae bacterium]|nr:MAG: hypothetical protein EPO28_12690 [Saprospiraceae bacterium]
MKKSSVLIPTFVFLSFFFLSFIFFDARECFPYHNNKSVAVDTFTVEDTDYSYSAQFTLSGNVVVFVSDSDKGNTEDYIDDVFGFTGVTYPDDFLVEYPSDEEVDLYMITNGEDGSEKSVPVALQFKQTGGTAFNGAGEPKHSCTGDPCNCCRFLKNIFGKIYGCECNTGGSCSGTLCNHTIIERG